MARIYSVNILDWPHGVLQQCIYSQIMNLYRHSCSRTLNVSAVYSILSYALQISDPYLYWAGHEHGEKFILMTNRR